MRGLPPTYYMPAFVVPDEKMQLLYEAPEFSDALKVAFGELDERLTASPSDKINSFMLGKTPSSGRSGLPRPLKSLLPPMESLPDRQAYEAWLTGKAILPTERFFHPEPTWNAGSTRHALLGDFQLKGIGVTGRSARVDFEHTDGRLSLYDALLETVVGELLHAQGHPVLRVAQIWTDGRDALIVRDAREYRLAQVCGEQTPPWFQWAPRVYGAKTPQQLLSDCLGNYTRLFLDSWTILAPGLDNLTLSGALIDCTGVRHLAQDRLTIPFGLAVFATEQELQLTLEPLRLWRDVIGASARTYRRLGVAVSDDAAWETFWAPVRERLGPLASQLEYASRVLAPYCKSPVRKSQAAWLALLQSLFPQGRLVARPAGGSRYSPPQDYLFLCLEIDQGKAPENPHHITDLVYRQVLMAGVSSPVEFGKALRRLTQT